MSRLGMVLLLAVMVSAWPLFGGFARLDLPGTGGDIDCLVLGGRPRE